MATGSADQPAAVVKLARRLKIPVRIFALDINHKMLLYAREMTERFPEIRLVQGDVFALPFADDSIDLIVNSLSLHHFAWEDAVNILKAMHRISRMGFIVNDLHRSRIAHASIFLTDAAADKKPLDPLRRAGFGDERLHAEGIRTARRTGGHRTVRGPPAFSLPHRLCGEKRMRPHNRLSA